MDKRKQLIMEAAVSVSIERARICLKEGGLAAQVCREATIADNLAVVQNIVSGLPHFCRVFVCRIAAEFGLS